MRRGIRLWFVVVGLSLVHFILHVGFGFGAVVPDMLTVALLLAAREMGIGWVAGLGLALGILEDSLSVLSFGASTVSMTLTGALAATTRNLFVGDSLSFQISYFIIGKWVRELLHWLMAGESLRLSFVEQVILNGILGGAYAAGIAVPLVMLMGWRRRETK
jgi:cell shape-determining protein MreD